jgi:hypothetical protein
MYGTLISSVTVGVGGASSIDWTSIPQTPYTDLVIILSGRGSRAATVANLLIAFNGSTTGFTHKELYGSGSSIGAGAGGNEVGLINGSSATTNTFSNNQIFIPNYAGSNNKSYSAETVTEHNSTTAYQVLYAGIWANTAAITSISLTTESSTIFTQYTTAYLYGLTKGSGGATVS